MSQQLSFKFTTTLLVITLAFSSCGNIDIVKRKHLPGFHVEMSKKKEKRHTSDEKASNNEPKSTIEKKEVRLAAAKTSENEVLPEFNVSSSAISNPVQRSTEKRLSNKVSDFVLSPFKELRRENLNSELRRAVFNDQDDEKHGWSVISMVSTGTSLAALALVIVGLVFLVMLIAGSSFLYWWAFALAGMLLGIGGMVMGIIGMRQTGRGENRGRGFALAGMIGGIVSLAAGIITLFWGLIFSLISGRSEDF